MEEERCKTPKAIIAHFTAAEIYNELTNQSVLTASGAEGKAQLERVRTRLAQIRASEAPAVALSADVQAELLDI